MTSEPYGPNPAGTTTNITGASTANSVQRFIGRVASPTGLEATTGRYVFWITPETMVEKGQLVITESTIGGRVVHFFAVIEEVYRRSRSQGIDEEVDIFDGDLKYEPPFRQEGMTYATAAITATAPPRLTPPMEQSLVRLGLVEDAGIAFGYDEMVDVETKVNWGLPIGLLRNGGEATLGVARVDIRDLCGDRAGHANVTGQAGHGTKSSFLLVLVRALIDTARALDDGNPGRAPFSVRPIVFNVKGNDLMYIDLPNKHLTAAHLDIWRQMDIKARPFQTARFVAPCAGDGSNRGHPRVTKSVTADRQTRPYFWTLEDVVRFGLWQYVFSEETQQNESMMMLADHVLGLIAEDCSPSAEHPAGLRLSPHKITKGTQTYATPNSFGALKEFLHSALGDKDHPVRDGGVYQFGTCRALLSRLGLVLGREGRPIFSAATGRGEPLSVLADGTQDPLVIDIATLPTELRRFVVAAVLDQVKTHQGSENRTKGQVYLLVLDELGIYAPRGGRDPISRLFEHVAAQLRSQGVILLGAQQQASKVSETIFGNSEVKALGATSPMELESSTWRGLLTPALKARALALLPEEKLVQVARGWTTVLVPFPAWAMKEAEADTTAITNDSACIGAVSSNGKKPTVLLRLPED